jgi:hypothetical protein
MEYIEVSVVDDVDGSASAIGSAREDIPRLSVTRIYL